MGFPDFETWWPVGFPVFRMVVPGFSYSSLRYHELQNCILTDIGPPVPHILHQLFHGGIVLDINAANHLDRRQDSASRMASKQDPKNIDIYMYLCTSMYRIAYTNKTVHITLIYSWSIHLIFRNLKNMKKSETFSSFNNFLLNLGGGFNSFEKHSQIGSFRQAGARGGNKKCLKPPPSNFHHLPCCPNSPAAWYPDFALQIFQATRSTTACAHGLCLDDQWGIISMEILKNTGKYEVFFWLPFFGFPGAHVHISSFCAKISLSCIRKKRKTAILLHKFVSKCSTRFCPFSGDCKA